MALVCGGVLHAPCNDDDLKNFSDFSAELDTDMEADLRVHLSNINKVI
jgi:hypothetical protein